MLIGSKDTVAIEYSLNEDSGGEWMFGQMCYWIHGAQVGDYEDGTSLRDVFLQYRSVVMDCGNRQDDRLCANLDATYAILNDALYTNTETGDTIASPARFEIKPLVDIFDNWKIFLVDCEGKSIVFVKEPGCEDPKDHVIELMEFDVVAKRFYEELGRLYEDSTQT